jgi:hypothetical protein
MARISIEQIMDSFDEFNDMVGSMVYSNYCFNRDKRPDIRPEQWEMVYGKEGREMEFLYQKERDMRGVRQ